MIGGAGDTRLGGGRDPLIESRSLVVAAGIVVMFGVFLLRLFQLQIVEGEDLSERSQRNSVRTVRLEAPRGDILDREGRTIATTRPAFRVEVIPNELRDRSLTFAALGQLLSVPSGTLAERVGTPRGRGRFQPVVLADDVPLDVHNGVESHGYALPGVVTGMLPRRYYVDGVLAAHLLGSIGEIRASQLETREFAGYRAGEIVGQRGLEALLESHLRGRAGGRNIVVDVSGREVEVQDEIRPQPGGRVVLALDLDLQRTAEQAFVSDDPETPDKMGALVALDPRNGDVLALVSRPAYDPNDFAGGIDADTWKRLTGDEWRPLQDRALQGQYPPGSTYKAFVAAAALEEGIIDPEQKVFCPGHFRLGRRTYRCWKRGGHGAVNLEEALVHSCDVYFYQLGLELGVDKLAYFARGFGLGVPTGIALPGEKRGLVPTSAWKEKHRHEPWIKGETVSTSIGQGYNLVTPLQLAVAYATIANGGTRYVPRLVLRLEDREGNVVEEPGVRVAGTAPVSPKHLARVRHALARVVNAPHGTGGRARLPDVVVAGKTGTSQVVRLDRVAGLEDDEIPIRYRDHAWFAAFAPAEAPEIVVAVLVEHGGSGGRDAAPLARAVLARYFEKQRERAGQAVAAAPASTPANAAPAAPADAEPSADARDRAATETAEVARALD